jgi:hypothetical protein
MEAPTRGCASRRDQRRRPKGALSDPPSRVEHRRDFTKLDRTSTICQDTGNPLLARRKQSNYGPIDS